MPTKWDLTMIKLEKSTTIPSSLATYGPEKAAGLIKRADSGDSDFKSEDFSHKIYADAQLKAQLIEDQHGKCAYCERKKGGDFGAVEHYRPKAGYQVSTKSKLIKPGYYWLAYEWNNLFTVVTNVTRHTKGISSRYLTRMHEISQDGILTQRCQES